MHSIEPKVKWRDIADHLRQQVIREQLTPDRKLPSYDDLAAIYAVSRITVRQAVQQLKQEGFLTAIERQGIFVNAMPPHLFRYGIVVPHSENYVRFWREFSATAANICTQMNRQITVYSHSFTSADCISQINNDIARQTLAGLFLLMGPPYPELVKPLFAIPALPKLVLSAELASPDSSNLLVSFDSKGVVTRGLQYLQQQGRQRIAYFGNMDIKVNPPLFDQEIQRLGLYSPLHWRFRLSLDELGTVSQIVQLMLELPESCRPDGIFIADDNLIPPVVAGVAGTRLSIPHDISVVSHYNWSRYIPEETSAVRLIGFDLYTLVKSALEAFDQWHSSGTLPADFHLTAQFAEELQR